MAYSPSLYAHDLDRKAFEALNLFPNFKKLYEAYIANGAEKTAKIELLSKAVRLNEKQKPEIYSLLPPICEKLGIDIPDLYMVLSENKKDINAFTGGSTAPMICLTTELVSQLPPEMISSVLAHECGHIACGHYLYHSLAMSFVRGIEASPLYKNVLTRKLLSESMISSLLFWFRCSELSADRAAVLCDGEAGKTIDTLLRINGFGEEINRDEFINQAIDLKSFINDSKANKIMEQMLVKDRSHPFLATRVYECYDWANSDRFRRILNGSVSEENADDKSVDLEEEEVIAAEVNTSPEDSPPAKNIEEPDVEAEINKRLVQLNSEIERYTNHADKADYALAIASGIISSVIDSICFSDTSIFDHDINDAHKQVNQFIQKYAGNRGIIDQNTKTKLGTIVAKLEKAFPVAQDNIWKGNIDKVTASNHHLADLAHHPTPLGLLVAIAVKFLRIGIFVNKDGQWSIQLVKIQDHEKKDMLIIAASAVISGIMNWLVNIAEQKYESVEGKGIPKSIHTLAHAVASAPILIEIFKCADNWFGHLVSDMAGSKNTADKSGGMGIPGFFLSFFYELASLPIIKDTGLSEVLNDLYTKGKFDFRHEIALGNQVKLQAVSVVFNELLVRTTYMIGQLVSETSIHKGFKGVNWRRVMPFDNRTVDRMLTVSSMTFNMFDTADAAIRAAVESCGDWVLFSGKFVARYNYIGAGRAAIAVVKEISNEKKEAQLIHERMLLMHTKAEIMYDQLQQFKAALEERLTNFLAEDIEAFMDGFDDIGEGVRTNNSDLVIRGNITIQRVLGREAQFTSQKEFDELMDSDVPLIL